MPNNLIDPRDSPEQQKQKLLKITESLMRRVEQNTDATGVAYAQFQRAVVLEEEVRARTQALERALDLLNESNARLAVANQETEAARSNLANAIETIQEGFALFDTRDELVMCNSRFGMHMRDIRGQLKPGLSFRDYVRSVSTSQYLSLPDGESPANWADKRLKRHKDDRAVFNARMTGDRWVQVSEHRTTDGGTVILQTDVTDIMRLERQERDRILDDQARLIRATLEHLKQGVCIFDNLGRLVGWNRRVGELLSIPVGRFHIGSRFPTIFDRLRKEFTFSTGTNAALVEDWVAGQSQRQPLSFEVMHGVRKTLAVFMQEMPDNGFVISFTDVTPERAAIRAISEANETLEQRVMERTLELEDALSDAERANASKSRFVAAASHDLLQPLSAAKLYVASLEGDQLAPPASAMVSKVGNALQSVENILGALLDISKLDSGLAAIDVSPVPLDEMLYQLHDELGPAARNKGLEYRYVMPGLSVSSDAAYLRRILQNLISNAIRYTDKGKVLVGARRRGSKARIEIWDTGPGISESDQDLIFGEFQRLNATASAADGMGLGLAIVERACALLNHPLHLDSTVGKGSVFSVEIPLATKEVFQAEQAASMPTRRNNKLKNLIVLLIENDNDLRNAITITMENWGVDVLPCTSESDARDLLEEIDVAPDMIVADYQLDDDKSGLDAIANFQERFGSLPACIISANRSKELTDACTDSGTALIHKPIDPGALRGFLLSE